MVLVPASRTSLARRTRACRLREKIFALTDLREVSLVGTFRTAVLRVRAVVAKVFFGTATVALGTVEEHWLAGSVVLLHFDDLCCPTVVTGAALVDGESARVFALRLKSRDLLPLALEALHVWEVDWPCKLARSEDCCPRPRGPQPWVLVSALHNRLRRHLCLRVVPADFTFSALSVLMTASSCVSSLATSIAL